jgi:hypothetical protein
VDDIELSKTRNRHKLYSESLTGDGDEVNSYEFLNTKYKTGKWNVDNSIITNGYLLGAAYPGSIH